MLPNPLIAELIKKAQHTDDSKLLPIYREIKDIGLKTGLLYQRWYRVDEVGCHRSNRENAMVNGERALNISPVQWRRSILVKLG